jgi:hypothetical protein
VAWLLYRLLQAAARSCPPRTEVLGGTQTKVGQRRRRPNMSRGDARELAAEAGTGRHQRLLGAVPAEMSG